LCPFYIQDLMPASNAPLPPARHAVLDLVRRGERTVNTLAARLEISDNAVRVHLVALERDGLLKRSGIVHSGAVGQPAAEYDITPAGELALSVAYPAVLTALTAAVGDRLDARARRALFMEAGRRLAANFPQTHAGSLHERAAACAALIDSLGGSATIAAGRGHATVEGAGCPLAAAVRAEPGTCALIEALLESHAGVNAEQLCTHGERPSCRFRLTS
jgi:predicted ArsR family transcriptional regulator